MRRSWVLVCIWVLGTGFAMAMAAFAVGLAGSGVTDGALPALASSDVAAELDANRSSGSGESVALLGTTPPLEPESNATAPTGDQAAPATTTTAVGGAAASPGASTVRGTDSGPSASAGSSGSGSSGSGSGTSGSGSGTSGSGTSGSGGAQPTVAPTTTQPPSSTHMIAAVGGSVTVRCVGPTVSILAASPAGGFTVDVRKPGPDEVEVRFENRDHTSTVKSTCLAGVAQPRVQESGQD